jgi:hypothetical protein
MGVFDIYLHLSSAVSRVGRLPVGSHLISSLLFLPLSYSLPPLPLVHIHNTLCAARALLQLLSFTLLLTHAHRIDAYPQRFDCSHPEVWNPVPTNFHQYHQEVNPSQVWYIPGELSNFAALSLPLFLVWI